METKTDVHAKIDALENERIEASLHYTFTKFGPVERLLGDDGSLWGWKVLGGVIIHRNNLPVDFSGDAESNDFVEHRQVLLDIMRAAYNAGRRDAYLAMARAM